jgi:hypothetical protein
MKENKIRLDFTIVFILIAFCLVSCKNDTQNESVDTDNKYSKKETITFEFNFPDTVYINQSYNGEIKYKSKLDTIITTFGDSKKNRYTRFIMRKSKYVNYDFKVLKLNIKDTFGALNNRTIPFYNIKFNELGIHYIDGIINDIVSIDTVTSKRRGTDLVRLIENEVRVTHKVVVIKKH